MHIVLLFLLNTLWAPYRLPHAFKMTALCAMIHPAIFLTSHDTSTNSNSWTLGCSNGWWDLSPILWIIGRLWCCHPFLSCPQEPADEGICRSCDNTCFCSLSALCIPNSLCSCQGEGLKGGFRGAERSHRRGLLMWQESDSGGRALKTLPSTS